MQAGRLAGELIFFALAQFACGCIARLHKMPLGLQAEMLGSLIFCILAYS